MPRSWRHWAYGVAYLGRAHLRAQLAQAEAVRMGGAMKDEYVNWAEDLRRQTEVPRG